MTEFDRIPKEVFSEAEKFGVLEKDINLSLSFILADVLRVMGYNAVMTRKSDELLGEHTKGQMKLEDLRSRVDFVKKYENSVFISIHMNKFSQPQYSGAQVFYGGKSEESKKLGDTIQETMKEVIDDGNTRVAKKIDGQIYILKNTSVPSVIIECGFLSNPRESTMLKNEDYRQKLAWSIYMGLVKYFNQ